MKIVIDKITKNIVGSARGNKTDFSYYDSKKYNVRIVEGNKLPDKRQYCRWDGKKVIVDNTLKQEAIGNEKKEKLIKDKLFKSQRAKAIEDLITEGKLNPDGSLSKG